MIWDHWMRSVGDNEYRSHTKICLVEKKEIKKDLAFE